MQHEVFVYTLQLETTSFFLTNDKCKNVLTQNKLLKNKNHSTRHMIKKNISLISDILNKPQATEESVKIQKHFCSLKDT